MTKRFFKTIAICAAICVFSTAALAQKEKEERGLNCDSKDRWNSDQVNHCVMREQTIMPGGPISVDGRTNGSVAVRGWDRGNIFVRAQIQTWARTDMEAKELADQVQVEINGTSIRSNGPSTQGRKGWAVSFEVFVPNRSDVSLKANNGSVRVSDVRGRVEFDTTNGSVRLSHVAGYVHGSTTNGSLQVELDGQRWDGEGMDVRTTNGSVKVMVPANYSARLETRTVNGGLNFDFPVTVQGKIDRELNTDLGSGGAPIRVQTTNGSVSIRRQ
jgi:hypothetical protein